MYDELFNFETYNFKIVTFISKSGLASLQFTLFYNPKMVLMGLFFKDIESFSSPRKIKCSFPLTIIVL